MICTGERVRLSFYISLTAVHLFATRTMSMEWFPVLTAPLESRQNTTHQSQSKGTPVVLGSRAKSSLAT